MKSLKLLLLFGTFVLHFSGQTQSANKYQIVGNIKNLLNGKKLYLIDGGKRKFIDSAIVKQGVFHFQGHLTEPILVYLYSGRGIGSSKLADILLDNRTIYVDGRNPEYHSVIISGSDIDQQWKEWMKKDDVIGEQVYALKQNRESLTTKKLSSEANRIDKRILELQNSRIVLLKSYVKRYYNTATGAALPTLCTLEASLTGRDYMEMYSLLTSDWQKSSFGREILSQAKKRGSL